MFRDFLALKFDLNFNDFLALNVDVYFRDFLALNVYVALCYYKLDYYDVSQVCLFKLNYSMLFLLSPKNRGYVGMCENAYALTVFELSNLK